MVATDVLRTSAPGFRRWNWSENRPGEWVALDPGAPLIIEGVGALTDASLRAACLRGQVFTVYLECPPETRKERALHRDPEFADWWDMWAEQEESMLASMPTPDITLHCDCSTSIG